MKTQKAFRIEDNILEKGLQMAIEENRSFNNYVENLILKDFKNKELDKSYPTVERIFNENSLESIKELLNDKENLDVVDDFYKLFD